MITVVSGLPRSGTSLVMQMLEKGGMEILTDHVRKADENNVRGYYEYEKVKSLKRDNSWLSEAENKAVKIIAQLLPFLLPQYQYAVLFVERPLDEILPSQTKMLESRGQPAIEDYKQLETIFIQQVHRVKHWTQNQSNIRMLCLQYHRLILHPEEEVPKIPKFLSIDMNLEAMISVIEPSLWHHRRSSTVPDSN